MPAYREQPAARIGCGPRPGYNRSVLCLDAVSVHLANAEPVLDRLSLNVEPGELLALVGPSGSGKTTALRVMNGLEQPDSGKVSIDGEPIGQRPLWELRRNMGYVIQDVGLFPHWTVEKNIACVPALLGWPKRQRDARAVELLEEVGLSTEYLSRYPSQLSGGERQRVGIARALAGRPRYLLMDEPFGAVDPLTRLRLRGLVGALRAAENVTTVLVTHDLQDALILADRIAILRRGRLVLVSTPGELTAQPKDPWAEEFLRAGGAREEAP